MRTIQIVVPFGGFDAGDHVEVDDQVACDAIAQGTAVPSVEAPTTKAMTAPENKAFESAPENK